jgi:hypothetical protein
MYNKMKKCYDCKVVLVLTEFNKDKNKKDGFTSICRGCHSIRNKKRYKDKKEYIKSKTLGYYYKNKEVINERAKLKPSYHKLNPNYYNEYRKTEKNKSYMKSYQQERQMKKYHTDAKFRLKKILSNQVRSFLKGKKNLKTQELLGYSYDDFIEQIGIPNSDEHIEHKVPMSWFKEETPINIIWNLKNLQILPSFENLSKGNRYSHELEDEFQHQINEYLKDEYQQ